MPFLGKDIRLARLLNPKSGKLLAITVDHSIARGIMAGLIPIQSTIDRIVAGVPDAMTMHKGIAEQCFGKHAGGVKTFRRARSAAFGGPRDGVAMLRRARSAGIGRRPRSFVIPREPPGRMLPCFLGVALEGVKIIQGIGATESAGVD